MFKSLYKIISTLLIVSLNWSGLSALCGTYAMFSDTEISTENILQAGTLMVSVPSASAFSPAIDDDDSESASAVEIKNNGSLPLYYYVSTATSTGDLCGMLELAGSLNGAAYSAPAPLASFASAPDALINGAAIDNWNFKATLAGGVDFNHAKNKTCNFTLAVSARQENLAFGQGFNDRAEIIATVSTASDSPGGGDFSSSCTHSPNIVINEFLPNPIGNDNAAMPGGEWVELYNADDHPVDLNGWLLYTSDTRYGLTIYAGNTNNGGTIIHPGGFLVVFRNGDPNFKIKKSGTEELRLFDRPIGEGVEDIDGVSYKAVAPKGKSFARIPDGIGEWIDPTPTPGEPNKLSDLEAVNPQKLDTVEAGNGGAGEQTEQQPEVSGEQESNPEEQEKQTADADTTDAKEEPAQIPDSEEAPETETETETDTNTEEITTTTLDEQISLLGLGAKSETEEPQEKNEENKETDAVDSGAGKISEEIKAVENDGENSGLPAADVPADGE